MDKHIKHNVFIGICHFNPGFNLSINQPINSLNPCTTDSCTRIFVHVAADSDKTAKLLILASYCCKILFYFFSSTEFQVYFWSIWEFVSEFLTLTKPKCSLRSSHCPVLVMHSLGQETSFNKSLSEVWGHDQQEQTSPFNSLIIPCPFHNCIVLFSLFTGLFFFFLDINF